MPLLVAGSNARGQLAVSDCEDRHRWTKSTGLSADAPLDALCCGANHTLIVDKLGNLLGAGTNERGQLQVGAANEDCTRWTRLPTDTVVQAAPLDVDAKEYTVVNVAATWETSFVVLRPVDRTRSPASDLLLSFGANDWSERGTAAATPNATRVPLPGDLGAHRIVDLIAGPRHVVALVEVQDRTQGSPETPPRRLFGWGASRQGQLGVPRSPPAPSVGTSSAALLPSPPPPRITPTPTEIPLPTPYTADHVLKIAVGKDHTALLLDREGDRKVLLLGSNKHGQLGPVRPGSGAARLSDNSAAEGKSASRAGPGQNLLSLGDLRLGDEADPPRRYRLADIGCTWNSTFLVLGSHPGPGEGTTSPASTRIVAFGSNSHGQLGRRDPSASASSSSAPSPSVLAFPSTVTRLACGSEHVLALLDSGEVLGWGWNEHGNLSLGPPPPPDRNQELGAESGRGDGAADEQPLADVYKPKRVWPPAGEDVALAGRAVNVWAGNATSWISVEDEVGSAAGRGA
ncbi:hypothetical protein JCM8202_004802 [Rhodotorula sphaerocarpa]